MALAEFDYPDPTQGDRNSKEFEAIWQAIKGWDIARGSGVENGHLYSGATGNDVMHILAALRRTK